MTPYLCSIVGHIALGLSLTTTQPIARLSAEQNPPPGRAGSPSPDLVGAMTITAHLPEIAGTYVKVLSVRVEDAITPHLFSLEVTRVARMWEREDRLPLVVLETPSPAIKEGTLVEVTGWVMTLLEARLRLPKGWDTGLDEDLLENENRAVIIANVVRAAGGLELYSRR